MNIPTSPHPPLSSFKPLDPSPNTPQKPNKHTEDLPSSTATSKKIQQPSPKDNKYTGCNCSKSQCLKMYCVCFSIGKMCDQTCLCQSCKNDSDNMQRSEAINDIITKDPYAFSHKNNTTESSQCACNCKKSACQKKYCECFRLGKQCGASCQCHGCHNRSLWNFSQKDKPTKKIKSNND